LPCLLLSSIGSSLVHAEQLLACLGEAFIHLGLDACQFLLDLLRLSREVVELLGLIHVLQLDLICEVHLLRFPTPLVEELHLAKELIPRCLGTRLRRHEGGSDFRSQSRGSLASKAAVGLDQIVAVGRARLNLLTQKAVLVLELGRDLLVLLSLYSAPGEYGAQWFQRLVSFPATSCKLLLYLCINLLLDLFL